MNSPFIAAIVVNWNGRDLTLRLLRSLREINYENFYVIVVDNGSSDGSGDAFRSAFPDIEIIELDMNYGYSEGINKGIKRAEELNADFYWVFNNDVVVKRDTLSKLLEAMNSDPKIGIAGPIVRDFSTGKVAHAGYRINMWFGWMKEIGMPLSYTPYEVDSAFGCSNLIRSDVVKDMGMFDRDYNVYFDETDFNTRARRKGWKVVVVPGAEVLHEESATMNKRLIRKAWLLLRNLLLFEIKNAKDYQLLFFLFYYFIVHLPYFFLRGSLETIRIFLKTRCGE